MLGDIVIALQHTPRRTLGERHEKDRSKTRKMVLWFVGDGGEKTVGDWMTRMSSGGLAINSAGNFLCLESADWAGGILGANPPC